MDQKETEIVTFKTSFRVAAATCFSVLVCLNEVFQQSLKYFSIVGDKISLVLKDT